MRESEWEKNKGGRRRERHGPRMKEKEGRDKARRVKGKNGEKEKYDRVRGRERESRGRGRQGKRDFALSCLQECCFIAFSLAAAVMNHTT